MRQTPRFFPTRLQPGERRVYVVATTFFVGLFVALVWPVYPAFGGIRPLVLGMPLSLVYIVALLLAGFLALLALFLWEGRRRSGKNDRSRTSGGGLSPAGTEGAETARDAGDAGGGRRPSGER